MSERVEIGQVWADNDWRSTGRTVEVVAIDQTHATVKVLTNGRGTYAKPGRTSRVRLDRFRPTSTGYRLVSSQVVAS